MSNLLITKMAIAMGLLVSMGFSSVNNEHELIELILNSKELEKSLNLTEAEDRAPIRILDLSKRLRHTQFAFSSQWHTVPLEGIIISKFPLDWNTGYFRDFIISSIDQKNDLIKITIAVSHFNRTLGKSRTRIEFTIIKKSKHVFEIVDSHWTNWD